MALNPNTVLGAIFLSANGLAESYFWGGIRRSYKLDEAVSPADFRLKVVGGQIRFRVSALQEGDGVNTSVLRDKLREGRFFTVDEFVKEAPGLAAGSG